MSLTVSQNVASKMTQNAAIWLEAIACSFCSILEAYPTSKIAQHMYPGCKKKYNEDVHIYK